MLTEIVATMPRARPGGREVLDAVGVELKLSMLLVGPDPIAEGEVDNDYWDKKCRLLFLRPAIEPVAISYWPRLAGMDLDVERAQKIVSALTTQAQVVRTREGVGRSASGNVGFEPPDRAREWLDRLKEAQAKPELASVMPAYVFASTIMAHPFADGNGRLARLLTLGALARLAGWDGPIVGLAPSFYRRAESMGAALDELTFTGNWDRYFEVFIDIMADVKSLMTALAGR